ncbi:MAG: pyruvate kinase [Agathobacter sp.]|nr:pyruvate kinase [Agathobacter sp.]
MNTQIFATMGPACGTENIIKEMIEAGMTGMRLNLSHTTLPVSKDYIEAYHNAAVSSGVKPQILIDMQGPELRVGDLYEPVDLEENKTIRFYSGEEEFVPESEGPEIVIPVPLAVFQTLTMGDEVLLDDGKILVKAVSEEYIGVPICEGKESNQGEELVKVCVDLQVLRGGVLRSHKSIKIVDKDVKMPVLTDHDIANIKLTKEYGVTALMQPFVRSGEDLRKVREILNDNDGKELKIFAKIENRTGVANMDSIIPEADVIVIARGDLGNDMPLWELPKVQKEIEAACKKYNKPYIVVTQMLASMEHSPVPTRAEVSDIFHAVYHGAWGVMVTGETAVGEYPVEVIRYLANTAKTVCER